MSGLSAIDAGTLFRPYELYRRMGLAVSGGADSLALMLLAHAWAKPIGVELFVYTVDHGLRPEAADEAAFVVHEAERLGLRARALKWSGPHPATGIQAAAREARYRLIGEAMASDGCQIVATAHHLYDQAETVLMRMAHGSGVDGLSGMADRVVIEGCEIVRPLLGVAPDQLREVVRAAGLVPVEDPSNDDSAYERVRWRKMLPALAALGLTPERLATFARRMGDQSAAIRQYLAQVGLGQPQSDGEGARVMARADFDRLPRAAGVALLSSLLTATKGGSSLPSLSRLEDIWADLRSGEFKQATIHGCLIACDEKVISIRREGPRRTAPKTRKAETAN